MNQRALSGIGAPGLVRPPQHRLQPAAANFRESNVLNASTCSGS